MDEVTPSTVEVLVADMRHTTYAKAAAASAAKAADVSAAEATDVSAAEAADVASAKPTHMTSTKAAHVASATAAMATTAAATPGLCARGKQAAGKHCACQYHHHSSSHDSLRSDGRMFRPRASSNVVALQQGNAPTSRWREDGNAE
jgi:hypothetical protein